MVLETLKNFSATLCKTAVAVLTQLLRLLSLKSYLLLKIIGSADCAIACGFSIQKKHNNKHNILHANKTAGPAHVQNSEFPGFEMFAQFPSLFVGTTLSYLAAICVWFENFMLS